MDWEGVTSARVAPVERFRAVQPRDGSELVYVRLSSGGTVDIVVGTTAYSGSLKSGSFRGVVESPSPAVFVALLDMPQAQASVLEAQNEKSSDPTPDCPATFTLYAEDSGIILELSIKMRRVPAQALLHELMVGVFAAACAWKTIALAIADEGIDHAQGAEGSGVESDGETGLDGSKAIHVRCSEILQLHASSLKPVLAADLATLASTALECSELPLRRRRILIEQMRQRKEAEQRRVAEAKAARQSNQQTKHDPRAAVSDLSVHENVQKNSRGAFLAGLGVVAGRKPTVFVDSQASSDDDGDVRTFLQDARTSSRVRALAAESRGSPAPVEGRETGALTKNFTPPDSRGASKRALDANAASCSGDESDPPSRAQDSDRTIKTGDASVPVPRIGHAGEDSTSCMHGDSRSRALDTEAVSTGEVSVAVSGTGPGDAGKRKRKKKRRRMSDRGFLL